MPTLEKSRDESLLRRASPGYRDAIEAERRRERGLPPKALGDALRAEPAAPRCEPMEMAAWAGSAELLARGGGVRLQFSLHHGVRVRVSVPEAVAEELARTILADLSATRKRRKAGAGA